MLSFVLPFVFPLLPVNVDQIDVTPVVTAASTTALAAVEEPELWFALPTSGQALTPVLMFGLNFADEGYAPRFDITPSIPIFQFGIDLPFIGKPSFMLTTAPPSLFTGDADLYLKKGLFGRESNRLTFTYL
jgi:hypothetical protein